MNTETPTTLPTRNPRSGLVDHQMPVADAAEVAAAAASLRSAQPAWAALSVAARAAVRLRWHAALRELQPAMLAALVADTGRLAEAQLEFDATLGALQRWCAQAPDLLAPEPPRQASIPFVRIEQLRRPYPVLPMPVGACASRQRPSRAAR